MTTTDTVVRQKVCPSCGKPFECCAGGCWCDAVALTIRTREALRIQYADCLCPACLRAEADADSVLGRRRE